MENLPFFIGLDQIITSMQLIFDDCLAIFTPKRVRVGFLCLLRIHSAYHLFPFGDGVSLAAISIDQDHDKALATHHVPQDVFKVRFAFMFVVQVDDFFLEELPLEHIFDGELFAILDEVDDLLQFLGLEDGVGFDDGHCEGEVHLFGVEEGLLHYRSYIFIYIDLQNRMELLTFLIDLSDLSM